MNQGRISIKKSDKVFKGLKETKILINELSLNINTGFDSQGLSIFFLKKLPKSLD